MNITECFNDSDCSVHDNDGVEIVRKCYETVEWTESVRFCDCAVLHGFHGEFCNQASLQTYLFRFAYTCQVPTSILIMVACFVEICYQTRFYLKNDVMEFRHLLKKWDLKRTFFHCQLLIIFIKTSC